MIEIIANIGKEDVAIKLSSGLKCMFITDYIKNHDGWLIIDSMRQVATAKILFDYIENNSKSFDKIFIITNDNPRPIVGMLKETFRHLHRDTSDKVIFIHREW